MEDSEYLIMMSPERFKAQHNIISKTSHEVLSIDRENKKVRIKNLVTSEEFDESYDILVLSQGAMPILPKSIPGITNENVFALRNVVDIKKIDDYIKNDNVKDVVVAGGGFIGIEVAENIKKSGKNVSIVEMANQVLAPFDFEMAQVIHKTLLDNGVNLILSDGLKEITEKSIVTNSGKEIKADTVIMSLAVASETGLAKGAGLEIGETGAILVNHNYQTSDEDIYAVGDAIEVSDFFTGKKRKLALAGPAQRQARSAADHIYGRISRNTGVIGSSAAKVFEKNTAPTGLNEKSCIKEGIEYDYVITTPSDKVSIMPGAATMIFNLIFAKPSGKILGAQAVGRGDVTKRIDVIATAIMMGATLEDLRELELCYSPVYSTARDVVNQAALVGENILTGEIKQVPVSKIRELVENNEAIIDVREEGEFGARHIKNAINIPLSRLRENLDKIPNDGRNLYVHCRSAQRSYFAANLLQKLGYKNVYNAGSFLLLSHYEYYTDITENREKILDRYNFN